MSAVPSVAGTSGSRTNVYLFGIIGIAVGFFAFKKLASNEERVRGNEQEPVLSREKIVWVLRKLVVRFHAGCRELTEMSRCLSENLRAKGFKPTRKQMRQHLEEQDSVITKLRRIQEKILAEEKLTPEQVRHAQDYYAPTDEEVNLLCNSFDTMLDDSLDGNFPVLPWMVSPDVDRQAVLDLLRHLHEFEIMLVCDYFREAGGTLKSLDALGRLLAKANIGAEREIAQMYNKPIENFYSCIGYYSKHSESFRREKNMIEKQHRARMTKMFKPASVKSSVSEGELSAAE